MFVFSDLLWASGLVFVFVAVGLCSLWVFFFFGCGQPVVLVVVVPVVDGRGGCGWWCNIFLVVEYIILL